MEEKACELRPTKAFLKWAGGKRWLAPAIDELFRGHQGRHVEPFAGSAACFFASHATAGLLGDSNEELINCFQVVRDEPRKLIRALACLGIDKQTFERLRNSKPRAFVSRAARFIYLNRTAFNGLYRVNRLGRFNVPFGCKPTTVICDSEQILACSTRLQTAELVAGDFQMTLRACGGLDHVFMDPPYTVRHNLNAFRRYNENIFSWDDQIRLAKVAHRLARQETPIVVTNACHVDVRRLYSPRIFYGFAVSRATNMAADLNRRGISSELLLVSHAVAGDRSRVRKILEAKLPARVTSVRLFGER